MKKGKQSVAGQAARRQEIIDYIKEHGPVKSGTLCAALDLSRSSLSDDINAINAQAKILTSPKRGYYQYDPQAETSLNRVTIRGKLDRTHIRRWFLLALLSEKPAAFESLWEALDDAGISCSNATLHTDLKELASQQYITNYREENHILYRCDLLHTVDLKDIRHYQTGRGKSTTNPRLLIDTYKTIDKKLTHSIVIKETSGRTQQSLLIGKQNQISAEQMDYLKIFQQFPYADYALSIPYRTNQGATVTSTFFTGLILYSVETNRFYLLGKNDLKRNTIIALDRVFPDKITVLTKKHNYDFQSAEFTRMFEEMFHLSTADPVQVKVRFLNVPFIAAKVRRLCEVRTHAHTELNRDGTEILYTDTLRGLPDFARYLRRFGRSALAEEPAELRESLLSTSQHVIALYEDPNDGQI